MLLDLIRENYFFYTLFLFVLGTCVGSFLNVCIHRLPKEELSVVSPPSHCPNCKTPLKWYDNIPVLGYLLLQGKCRYCSLPISARYIFVEVLSGYLFVEYDILFGHSPEYIAYLYLTLSLVVVTFIDIKYQIIPDEINFLGMLAGLLLSTLFPSLHSADTHLSGFLNSLYGIFAGGGIVYFIGVFGEFVFKKEAMGGGDVKLMGMIGAFLGWKLALLSFFLAPFFGSVIGIYVKYVKKEDIIPFGPFLAMGALTALFWGNDIISYLIAR